MEEGSADPNRLNCCKKEVDSEDRSWDTRSKSKIKASLPILFIRGDPQCADASRKTAEYFNGLFHDALINYSARYESTGSPCVSKMAAVPNFP